MSQRINEQKNFCRSKHENGKKKNPPQHFHSFSYLILVHVMIGKSCFPYFFFWHHKINVESIFTFHILNQIMKFLTEGGSHLLVLMKMSKRINEQNNFYRSKHEKVQKNKFSSTTLWQFHSFETETSSFRLIYEMWKYDLFSLKTNFESREFVKQKILQVLLADLPMQGYLEQWHFNYTVYPIPETEMTKTVENLMCVHPILIA